MDQGSAIHDSNQNNLLTLLSNFGHQGDFSSHLEGDKQPIVISANTNKNPIGVHSTLEAGPSQSNHVDTNDIIRSESVHDTTDKPLTDSDSTVSNIRKSVSHSNIRKTINEIANNQSLISSTIMPQNALLETPISVANMPGNSSTSGNEFISAQTNMELMQSSHNIYQGQNWTTGDINIGNTVGELCDANGFNARQPCISASDNTTTMVTYPDANMVNCFAPNQVQQQQQFMPTTNVSQEPSQLDQFLHNTQLSMRGYDQHLNQATYASSTSDLATTISTYEKMDSFNPAPLYNSNLQPHHSAVFSTDLHQSIPMSYGDMQSGIPVDAYQLQSHGIYHDMGHEDTVLGNHNKEKKLTTTPIPSDAEKMSSSGSSTSSSSPGESPSPRTDPDPAMLSNRPGSSKATSVPTIQTYSYSSDKQASQPLGQVDQTLAIQGSATGALTAEEMYFNDNLHNQIPVPESVVEIDESLIEYNVVEAAPADSMPVSPPNSVDLIQLYPSTSARGSSSKASPISSQTGDEKSLTTEANHSWSVLKEERRKQKLEKKMQQARQQAADGQPGLDKVEKGTSQSRKHHKHKHKRSKHHHSIPPNVIAMPVIHSGSGNAYSGIIPKVTADPTNNMKSSYKPAGPPRSITEKVKQQMMQEKLKATTYTSKPVPQSKSLLREPVYSTVNANTTSALPQASTTMAIMQPTTYTHIAPSKFPTLSKEGPRRNSTCRWQTVTAIQDPKLPPMLSERDRIPKRGRPSKKMTEMNLKLKAKEAASKVSPVPAVSDNPNLVSTYTINERGGIEKLENKPKQTQRNKERAEAFKNELLEISKKTTIQLKTAGAKEAVGAFKAVGVRTRKQATTNSEVEDGKKKINKTKNKVFGGETSTPSKDTDKIMDENCMYTFSELAKQFKISNSILYRAIEQSHRSSMSRRNSKSSHKHREKVSVNQLTKLLPPPIPEIPQLVEQIQPPSAPPKEDKVDPPPEVTNEVQSTSPIKPTSLSSEKSADLSVESVKRKKKKKKHKKEKSESGKKKKNKDKKKKSKKKEKALKTTTYNVDSNNEVFASSSGTLPNLPVIEETGKKNSEKKQDKATKSSDSKSPSSVSKPPLSAAPAVVSPQESVEKIASVSSVSAAEDVDEVSDSFSDTDISTPVPQSIVEKPSTPLPSITTTTQSPTSVAATVFGSGISSIMPTFQGIKEHGGLQQFSEHTKMTEESLFRAKKHKHKKKKPVSRAKNVTDPEFSSKMDQLVQTVAEIKLSSHLAAPIFGRKVTNVFAKSFSAQKDCDDSFSYRDPTAGRSKTKQASNFSAEISADKENSNSCSDMSFFCRSSFFTTNNLIKPYKEPTGANLLKSVSHSSSLASGKENEVAKLSQKSKVSSNAIPSSAANAASARKMVEKSHKGEDPQEKIPTDSSIQVDMDNSTAKPGKRRRGWPKGKPRGSRAKLHRSLECDSSVENKLVSTKTQNKNQESSKKEAYLFPSPSKKSSKETKLVEEPNQQPVLQKKQAPEKTDSSLPPQPAPGATSAPINQDLVNHIKAVITASLSSSAVCKDTVARTVDSAVASYMQNIETPLPTQTSSLAPEQDKVTVPRGRPRGRPHKYPKVSNKESDQADMTKLTEKHPKKVWASKHQGVSATPTDADQQPVKRKPGRPRKYPSLEGEVPAKIQKRKPKSKEPVISNRLPTTEAATQQTSKRTETKLSKIKIGRGRRPSWMTEASVSKSSKSLKPPTAVLRDTPDSFDSIEKLPSAKSSSSKSIKAVSPVDEDLNKSTDSALKSGLKKSLESVVAQLKSKQSSTSSCSSSEPSPTDRDSPMFQDDIGSNSVFEKLDNIFDEGTVSSRKRQNIESLNKAEKQGKKEKFGDEPPKKKQCLNKQRKGAHTEKKWIDAGLFSLRYKLNSDGHDVISETDIEKQELFPPPLHAGLFLRQRVANFQLPYDVMSMYRRNKISSNQNVSDNYVDIEENIYYDVTPTNDKSNIICSCSSTSSNENCLKNCKNRLARIECSPLTCPNGERCSNSAILNNRTWKKLEKYQTSNKTWGMKTTADIPEGQFLLEYVGEILSEAEFKQRWIENYSAQANHYSTQLEPGNIIDAYRCGNIARFVNHSCQPNCEMQQWCSGGKNHLCLFSNRPIKSGEELTYDYSTCWYELLEQAQNCSCESSNCRGKIIGVRSQQTAETSANRPSKPSQSSTGKKKKSPQDLEETGQLLYTTVYENHMQPASPEETQFIKAHKPFLLRNLAKIKRQHELLNKQMMSDGGNKADSSGHMDKVEKQRLLYDVIKDIFDRIMGCKDENGVSVAIPFINLRNKQSGPDHSKDPFDLSFVEDKIVAKQYEKFDEFSSDLLHAFRNAEKQFGRKSAYGKDVARLRRVYATSRSSALAVLGETRDKGKTKDANKSPEMEDRRKSGDFIRCICGIYKDEGFMIQCEKCYVWQHCDCMQVKPGEYSDGVEYLCEECDDREVPQEVEVVPQPPSAPPGHTYFLTLRKDHLLIRQGDCVRLIHDHCLRQRPSNNPPIRSSYRLQSHSAPERMDYFRIEKLWTDDSGDKFAYGYHFARPQDTKHSEPRVFFTNELLATPYHEIVPLDAVVSRCCVMDLETYRRGKPKEFKESDIFICQHRTDLSLRIINRVIKNRYPICAKSHVFDTYPVRLVTVRNCQSTAMEIVMLCCLPSRYNRLQDNFKKLLVPEQYRKSQSRRTQWLRTLDHVMKSEDEDSSDDEDDDVISDQSSSTAVAMETGGAESDDEKPPSNERNLKEKRLNGILKKLKDAAFHK